MTDVYDDGAATEMVEAYGALIGGLARELMGK
jgi:hypothetical protein